MLAQLVILGLVPLLKVTWLFDLQINIVAFAISAIIGQLSDADISQIPVTDENGWIKGIVRESTILKAIFNSQVNVTDSVDSLVDTSIEFVTPGHSIDRISKLVTEGKVPLITDPDDGDNLLGIITDIDLLNYLGSRNAS